MEKLFTVQVQKHHAELIIETLAKSKDSIAREMAKDLNERYRWNYSKSVIS